MCWCSLGGRRTGREARSVDKSLLNCARGEGCGVGVGVRAILLSVVQWLECADGEKKGHTCFGVHRFHALYAGSRM